MTNRAFTSKATASPWLLAILTAGAVFLTATSTKAQLINVDFNGNSVGAAYGGGGPNPGPNQTGAAILGTDGDLWNGIDNSLINFSAYPNNGSASGLPLYYSDGTFSSVTLSLTTFNTFDVVEPVWSSTNAFVTASSPYANLMQDVLVAPNGNPQTLTLSGLGANQMFDLVLYSAGNQAGRISSFTVNGVTKTSTYDNVTSTLVDGVTYVRYATATADDSGNLVITYFSDVVGPPAGEANLNGFQLMAVPEPSTFGMTALGGLALLFVCRRSLRRA